MRARLRACIDWLDAHPTCTRLLLGVPFVATLAGGSLAILVWMTPTLLSPCSPEYETATLEKVPWVAGVPGVFCPAGAGCSDAALDAHVRRAAELRRWSATLDDRCVRDAYAGWADYVDVRVARARKAAEAERRAAALAVPAPPASASR